MPFFAGIDRARFHRPVVPGDQLRIVGEMLKSGNIAKISAKAYVDDELAAEAELMFAIQDRE